MKNGVTCGPAAAPKAKVKREPTPVMQARKAMKAMQRTREVATGRRAK